MTARPAARAEATSDDAQARLGRIESVLTTDQAVDVMRPAFATEGLTVVGARRSQVVHRPGESITVQYDVTLHHPSGRESRETVVASAGRDGPPEGSLVVEDGEVAIGLYRWTHDPALPGLRPATDRAALVEVLRAETAVAELRVRSYRPLERAVVHVVLGDGTERYVKVVPPSTADRLVLRHEAVAATGAPVPAPLVVDAERGLVVIEAVEGRRLQDLVREGGGPLPDPDELMGVSATLATARVEFAVARRPPLAALHHHVAVLGSLLPASQRRIERLVDQVGPDPGRDDHTVHGDLHPGQVLVHPGGTIAGVIDLDDVGLGDPLDDLATHLGHLFCVVGPRPASVARAHAGRTLARFEREGDPADLHRRVAAILVGLAVGPHRAQRPGWRREALRRLGLAERFARGDVRTLRSG